MTLSRTRPVDLLLSRLDKVQENSRGWRACCPAHGSRGPTLAVTVGDDGRALVKCFAGCTVDEVAAAVGLTVRDLFDGERQPGYVPPPPPPRRAPAEPSKPKEREPLGRLVKAYDYDDENGVLLFQVCRFDPKYFLQRQPKAGGGWAWNLSGVRMVLYRLPSIVEAIALERTIYLCEGEKDADALVARGCTATTAPMGASKGSGKWRDEYTALLAGARVVYLPDNDPAGEAQAVRVSNELVSVAAAVSVVRLPDLPPKGDVSVWLQRGGTIERLVGLVRATKPVRPARRWGITRSWAK